PSFYARQDMKTPMWFSGMNALANIALSLTLFPVYGVVGLAIATSIAGWLNAFLLWGSLMRGGHFVFSQGTVRNLFLIGIASIAMAAVLFVAGQRFESLLLDAPLVSRLLAVAGLVGVAAFIYFAIVIATGAIPRAQLARLLRRK
ncbi:MAG: lipid II flippase MurJ, partial [Pseudomonadota bacterium]